MASEPKMAKKKANRLAKKLYGPTANAIANSDVMDRTNRFGIVYIAPAGMKDRPILICAGYGESWELAFEMARKSPVAEEQRKFVEEANRHLDEYMKDPDAFVEKYGREQLGLTAKQEENKES